MNQNGDQEIIANIANVATVQPRQRRAAVCAICGGNHYTATHQRRINQGLEVPEVANGIQAPAPPPIPAAGPIGLPIARLLEEESEDENAEIHIDEDEIPILVQEDEDDEDDDNDNDLLNYFR
jgi:hypothetical protein